MGKKKAVAIITISFGLCISGLGFAETIILKSGRTIEGKIREKTDEYIKLDYLGISLTYYWEDIENISEESTRQDESIVEQLSSGNQFHLTKPENCSVEIDGEKYSFAIVKYEPAFISPPYLLNDKSEQNLTTPEGANIAIWSSVSRDSEWYLSLHDEKQREKILESDRKSYGQGLEEVNKGKPLRDPVKEGSYEEFICKIEIEVGGKKYSIIQIKRFVGGQEFPGYTTSTYVKQNDSWLRSSDLQEHPVKRLVGLKSCEEINAMCGGNEGPIEY